MYRGRIKKKFWPSATSLSVFFYCICVYQFTWKWCSIYPGSDFFHPGSAPPPLPQWAEAKVLIFFLCGVAAHRKACNLGRTIFYTVCRMSILHYTSSYRLLLISKKIWRTKYGNYQKPCSTHAQTHGRKIYLYGGFHNIRLHPCSYFWYSLCFIWVSLFSFVSSCILPAYVNLLQCPDNPSIVPFKFKSIWRSFYRCFFILWVVLRHLILKYISYCHFFERQHVPIWNSFFHLADKRPDPKVLQHKISPPIDIARIFKSFELCCRAYSRTVSSYWCTVGTNSVFETCVAAVACVSVFVCGMVAKESGWMSWVFAYINIFASVVRDP